MKKSYYYLGASLFVIGILAFLGSRIPAVHEISSRYLVGATDYLLVYVDNPLRPPPDFTPPIVTLIGSASVTLNINDVYTELGATSTDNIDSNLPIHIYVDGSPTSTTVATTHIDTSIAGGHAIVYSASDSSGNVGTAIRVVVVSAPQSSGGGGGGGGASSGGGGGGAVGIPVPVTQTGGKCSTKGDLNGDGKINIVDFSILAYWYKRPLTAQAIAQCVDQTKDGKVTLADFSILAYYWTK